MTQTRADIISQIDLNNAEYGHGLAMVEVERVKSIIQAGVDAAWPDVVWSMSSGEITMGSSDLLNPYNTGPVIGWMAEQNWEAIGKVVGGRMVANLVESRNTTFGLRLRGFWCNSIMVPVYACLASIAVLHRDGGALDEMINRFRLRFEASSDFSV